MRLRGRLTSIPDDLPVDGATGEVRTVVDNTLLGTVTTDIDGWYAYAQDGNPGPIYIDWDVSGVTHLQYSAITGPSGPVDIAGLPHALRAWSNGYITGVGDELAISATGSAMAVAIGSGAALVQGILYDQGASKNLLIDAAHATLPRVDRIVVRVVPAGAGADIEGKSTLAVVKGTAVAGADAAVGVGLPALTQTTALWEEEIGRVQVDAAVPVIASNKVVRSASAVGPRGLPNDIVTAAAIAAGAVGTSELADEAVTNAKIKAKSIWAQERLADGSIGPSLLENNAVTTAKIANGAVTAEKMSASGVTVLMPGSEFVATGGISSGSRTLVTLGVGPLTNNVWYAIVAYFGMTVRNSINTGTVVAKLQIDGGAVRTHEFQNVGGVPRWCPIMQSLAYKGTGASINVVGSVTFNSGDTSDIRAGWVQVVAVPLSILGGV
jgi:hypothetical protein